MKPRREARHHPQRRRRSLNVAEVVVGAGAGAADVAQVAILVETPAEETETAAGVLDVTGEGAPAHAAEALHHGDLLTLFLFISAILFLPTEPSPSMLY